MHRWVRRALCAAGLAGGTVLLGIGLAEAASADTSNGPVTTGESGILSGNQTGVAVQAPVNVSGNQLTVIGQDNHATSTGAASTSTAAPATSTAGSPTTSGQNGGGSGNQTAVHALAPVNASGNQVTVIGQHNTATASGGSTATQGSSGSPTTSGQGGLGSGNQTGVTALVPVNVSGNQVTVIGQHNTLTSLGGSSTGGSGGTTTTSSGSPTTSGQDGLGSGNQTGVTALVPVDVSGDQVTVIGQHNTVTSLGGSSTGGSGGTTTTTTSSGSPTTSGQSGIGSGNQTGVTALVPVNVSGDQVTVIGQDNTVTSLGGSSTGGGTGPSSATGPVTSGQSGIGSGNQTGIDVLAPIAATGDQVTVIGQDNTVTSTGGSTTGGSTGGTTGTGGTTSGAGGIGSGNQTPISVQVPVDVSGDQVTVIGQGNTVTSSGGATTGGGTTGGTTGGGTTSPPSGGVVSPPTSGGGIGTSHAAAGPVSGTLPSTGMPADLLAFALLGALLLLLGSALVRREAVAGTRE